MLVRGKTLIFLFCSVAVIIFAIAAVHSFLYKESFFKLYSETLLKFKDGNKIIDKLNKRYIHRPSMLPYRLSRPGIENPSPGQCEFVDNFFKKMTDGFFIESGAFDGEQLSNTLFLERFRNWTGLLVEPNPSLFASLIKKNRKAYAINACLSTKKYPSIETFNLDRKPAYGHVIENENNVSNNSLFKFIRVQCFPLFSILQAINRFEIDYFSLDIEGAEEGVLKTLPWARINIKTISIEHNKWQGGIPALLEFMKSLGYKTLTQIKNKAFARDFIFQKEERKNKH